jgi:hypothetical protein
MLKRLAMNISLFVVIISEGENTFLLCHGQKKNKLERLSLASVSSLV